MPASWRKHRRLAPLLPPSLRHHLASLPKATGLRCSKSGSSGFLGTPRRLWGLWVSVPCCLGSLQKLRLSRESTSYPPGSSPPLLPTLAGSCLVFLPSQAPCYTQAAVLPPTTPRGSILLALCHSWANSEAAASPGPQILALPRAAESFIYQLA